MKYFLIAAICFLRINSFCYAQNTQSVLWEISGNGLAKKSYLFGTIHTAKTDIYYSFPKLNSIIKKCDIGLFEMSGKPINGVNKKNNDTSNIQPPPLGKVFTAREFAIVDSFFTRSPFGSIQPTDSLPLFAVLQLATLVKQTGGKQETLFDGFLCTQMEMLKKPTFALDNTNDPSIRAVVSDTAGMVKQLMATIKGTTKGDPEDDNYTSHLTVNMMLNKNAAAQIKVATIKRNLIWMPKITNKIKQGSCFIAVGLGHLKYNTGLIRLLRNQGYVLKPVTLKKSIL